MIDEQKQRVNYYKKHAHILWKVYKYKTPKKLSFKFFIGYLFIMKFECPVYRGLFVLKWPFLGRKSVRFKEGPVYECPVYRGKINKKNFLAKQNFQNCPA